MIVLKHSFSVGPSLTRLAGAGRGLARIVCASILAFTAHAYAAPYSFTQDAPLYRGGLCNSAGQHSLNARQLQAVLESLRRKTGFLALGFDQAGCLTLGDGRPFAGGSATARELLIALVEGQRLFRLEAYSHAPQIAFANLSGGIIHENWRLAVRVEVRSLQLDFADFKQLRGSDEARAAFDIGLAILHELAHGIWRLPDTAGAQPQIGSCEEHINRIRRELGLPERQSYHANVYLIRKSERAVLQAELLFVLARPEAGRVSVRRFYLQWDADQVAHRDHAALRPSEQTTTAAAAQR